MDMSWLEYVTLGRVFWGGWIVLLAIGFLLGKLPGSALKRLGAFLAGLSSLWFIGLFFYAAYKIVIPFAFQGVPLNDIFEPYWTPFYAFVESYAGYWTNGLIYGTPFFFMVAASIFNKKFSENITGIMGVWAGMLIMYFVYWSVMTIKATPLALIHYITFFAILMLFDFSTNISARYSTNALFHGLSGLKSRNKPAKSSSNDSSPIRQIIPLAIFVAYWNQLEISTDTLIELYSALFSGLLSIIGFAALIFTFSFQRIQTSKLRRNISQDTRAIYRTVAIISAICVIGLSFFSDSNVVFNVTSTDFKSAFAVSVVTISVMGTLYTIDSTVELFKKLINVISGFHMGEKLIKIAFDELRTPAIYSADSDDPTGLSALKSHLEDKGFQAGSFDKAGVAELGRLNEAILVLHRIETEVVEGDAVLYREFVERGDVLIVLVDAVDLGLKANLLKTFNVDAAPIAFPEETTPIASVDKVCLSEMKTLGAFDMKIASPVAFSTPAGFKELARCDGVTGPWGDNDSATMIISSRVGKGLVILVGGIAQWQNANFANDNNIDCLDAIIAHSEKHIMGDNEEQLSAMEKLTKRAAGMLPAHQ